MEETINVVLSSTIAHNLYYFLAFCLVDDFFSVLLMAEKSSEWGKHMRWHIQPRGKFQAFPFLIVGRYMTEASPCL